MSSKTVKAPSGDTYKSSENMFNEIRITKYGFLFLDKSLNYSECFPHSSIQYLSMFKKEPVRTEIHVLLTDGSVHTFEIMRSYRKVLHSISYGVTLSDNKEEGN